MLDCLNPFTAPARNISGLKDAWCPCMQTFSSPVMHLLSMIYVLMKILSQASAKIETKRLKDFKFLTVSGGFQVAWWQ